MIVVCTSCSAKFRVPDEKIGPRGAKLRCSKCQHVFVVKREPAGATPPPAVPPPLPPRRPAVELALEDGGASGRRAGPGKGAFTGTFGASPGLAAPAQEPPAPDQALPQPEPPPFPAQADPFAAAGPALGQGHLPVTDLSDLAPPPAPPPPAAEPPPFPPEMAEQPPLGAEPPQPEPAAPAGDAGLEFDRDFNAVALEERTPAKGAGLEKGGSIPMPGLDAFGGADPFAGHGEGVEPGPAAGGDLGGGFAEPPPPATAAAAAPAPAPVTRPTAKEERPAEVGPPGPIPARQGRLHAFIVNVISLGVLLAVTLALIALWQGEGHFQPRFLRRLPFLADWGGTRGEAPLVAQEVTNGLYETARGGRILFVRGRVEARSAVPGPVQVRAEILRGDQVLARIAGPAGAVPTPEELQAVDGPGDARRLEALLAPRAVRGLKAGESAPFLLFFTEVPPRPEEITFRVVAEPAPRG